MPALAGISLLGFGLRAGRLEFQSLWYDEGSSIFLSHQSLADITQGTAADIHPPLYYYLLHFWMGAAGDREYAVRFLSLCAGLLIVPLLFVLGRRLLGHRAGLIAALLGAVSPLLVYFSQETRMYAQVTLFGLLSTYLLVRATESLAPLSASLLARARTPASLAGQPARSLATLRQPASGTGNPQQPGSGLGTLRRAGDSGSGLGPLGKPGDSGSGLGPLGHPGDSGSGLGPLGQPGDSGSGLGTLRRAGDSGSGAPFKAQPAALLWPAFAAAAAACLYSQYIGALALAFQGLFVLGWRRKALTPFLAAAGSAVVVFLPWLALAKSSLLGWPSTDAFHAGPGLFADAAFRYVLGLSAGESPATWAAVAIVSALAVLSAIVILSGARNLAASKPKGVGFLEVTEGTWLPVLYLLVPLAAMFLLGLRKPVYNPKFALLALPGFLLLLAAGLDRLGRLKLPALALTLAISGYALYNYDANPAFARDDYRGLSHFIASSQRPGDAVILDAPGQEQIFPYYYAGGLPIIGLPADRPLNPDKTSQQLTALNGHYQRLWLVLYGTNGSDPEGYVEKWLASRDFEIEDQWFGNARLAAFAVPKAQAQPAPADATIGNFAHLSGYSLTPNPVASGDVLQLGLQWQAAAQAPGDVKVFTHVIDSQGNIWAQRDSDPAGGARPTSGWRPGQTIDDNYGLLVLPGTPPGRYQVELGMYTAADGKRLPVSSGGDRLLLTDVDVGPPPQPPSIDELRIPHLLDRQFGAFRLLGYSLTLVGQDAERDTFAAGDEMHLTLFWQAGASTSSDAQFMLRLTEPTGRPPAPPAGPGQPLPNGFGTLLPQHPTTSWHPGDRYRDQHRLQLSANVRGDFDLTLWIDGTDATPLARLHIR